MLRQPLGDVVPAMHQQRGRPGVPTPVPARLSDARRLQNGLGASLTMNQACFAVRHIQQSPATPLHKKLQMLPGGPPAEDKGSPCIVNVTTRLPSTLHANPAVACQTHGAVSAPGASRGAVLEGTTALAPCSRLALSTRLPPRRGTSVLPAPSSFALSFLAPSTCKQHGGHIAGAAVHAGSARLGVMLLLPRCGAALGSLASGQEPAASGHKPGL